MRESSKDAVEHYTGLALEAAASLIPGIGGVVSVAIGETVRRAESERAQRTIAELRAEVHRVLQSGRVPDIESAVTSDAFLAAAHRVLRDMQETSNVAKRRRLARALGRSLEPGWSTSVEDFARMIADFDELTVALLASVAEKGSKYPWMSPTELSTTASTRLDARLGTGRVVGALRSLEGHGLVEWRSESALADGAVDQAKDGSMSAQCDGR